MFWILDSAFFFFFEKSTNSGFMSTTYIRSILSLYYHIKSVVANVFINDRNDHILQREYDAFPWHY